MPVAKPELIPFADALMSAKRGWTTEDLADAVGVSRQTISSWQNAQAQPQASAVRQLEKVLGVQPGSLYRLLPSAGPPVTPNGDTPDWARNLGDLSPQTVAAIRLLIDADRRQRQPDS